jgi:signal transduction histidine kinase
MWKGKKAMDGLHIRYQNKSTPVRSILILMVAVVLIAAGFMLLFIRNNMKRSEREIAVLYGKSADAYITAVEGKLGGYFTSLGMVGLNQSVRQNIFRTDVTPSQMVEIGRSLGDRIDEMTFFLYRGGEVRQHSLYTYLPADGRYFFRIQDAARQPWYQKVQKKSPCWCYSHSNVTDSNLLTIASVVNAFGSERPGLSEDCYQTITVDTSILFSPGISNFPDQNTAVFVFDNDGGKLVYGSDPKMGSLVSGFYGKEKAALTGRARQEADDLSFRGGGKSFSVLSRPLSNLNATVLFLYEPVGAVRQEDGSELALMESTGGLLVAFLVILLLFYWIFTRRLNRLIRKMDGFDEQNFIHPSAIGGTDEIARIDRHLVGMQERIHTLIRQEYAAELDKMKAQNEALISCINPHFLYNTLNSISAMAGMEGADGTADMICSLSSMFRYSSNVTEKFVKLRMELQNVFNYLHIQNIRYGDSFRYRVEVEAPLQELPVPKQILQPVVENVFTHAFRGSARSGRLLITAETKGKYLILSVRDNGSGIPAEALKKLNRSFEDGPDGDGKGGPSRIGLRNVHHRLRLIYGDGCGLSLTSAEGEYTCVEIRLLREPPERLPQSLHDPASHAANIQPEVI